MITPQTTVKRTRRGKIDFHLHSYASNVTDYYAANAFAIPESYSEPLEVYRLLRARGMSLVTLTDHNSIDGVRELLDSGLPDVFISAEMTTTFPEDGCNIHVTVANMTETQFTEVHRLRKNVYEMLAFVDSEIEDEEFHPAGNRLAYFMTHPLMSTQNRPYGREGSLAIEHIEKALLLCQCFEAHNGARTTALNALTTTLLRRLDRETMERLAEKHGVEPTGATPWLKAFVGGSDDHSGIHPGHTWTEFEYEAAAPTANDVVDSIRRRATVPAGVHGGPVTLAHSVLKLLYDGSRQKRTQAAKSLRVTGPVQALLRLVFDSGRGWQREPLSMALKLLPHRVFAHPTLTRYLPPRRAAGTPFEQVFESEVYALLADSHFRSALARLDATAHTDERIFLVVGTLLNRVFARYVENLRHTREISLVGFIKEVVALVTSNVFVSLPYLMSFVAQSSDCLIARDVRKSFGLEEQQKLVLVTDTLFEVNGVAATIKRMIRESQRRSLDFTVVTCLAEEEMEEHLRDPEIRAFVDAGRLKIFPAVASITFPEYDRLQIRFPPFLDFLRYLQESGFTKMQISTPGVIGLSGLLAAKTLQMETAATYHTSIPEYVENYTRDMSLEALAWKYMIAFYHAVDEVVVPSKFIARLLHKRGLRNRKLLTLDRWVDVDRFHPRHRTPGFWNRYGIQDEGSLVKFIYVGRLGVEKNLALVADAYRELRATSPDCHLVIVGDGPYRADLERRLEGLPVTFTGFLAGTDLCRAYASADVKVFPSTTDTWGNAPLEGQASGLPVIVSTVGGPAELMLDEVTGLTVGGRDSHELCEAMRRLLAPELRARLGRRARAYAEARRVDEPFTAIFDADTYRRRAKAHVDAPDDVFDATPVSFFTEAGAEGAKIVRVIDKLKARFLLSRAKHPSLRGHAKMSQLVARALPHYEYGEAEFFGVDGAPAEVVGRRREGFERLSAHLMEGSPRTLELSEALENGLSDVAFINAYRVPFQFRRYVAGRLRVGCVVACCEGSRVCDLDGNWAYDVGGSYGVNLFGQEFYKACMDRGFARARGLGVMLGSYPPLIAENVERLKAISGLDEVSFHMSGTEAVMQAVRLARYHTGRSHLVRFCGAYHGWWDGVQAGVGNPRPPHEAYTLKEMDADTLHVLETRNDIACVLVNPIQAMNPNGAPPGDSTLVASDRNARYNRGAYADWLRELSTVCARRAIVFIVDDVFMGFRLAPGGTQEYFGVRADLVTYGKTLGGGLPVGVVCGRSSLMRRFRDDRPGDVCFARGTFNSHPVVMATMNEFLRRLDDPAIQATYSNLDARWDARAASVNERLERRSLPVRVVPMTSVWTTVYLEPGRYNWMFQYYLRAAGLALGWIGTGRFIFSHDLTDDDFAEISRRIVLAAETMQDDGWWWRNAALSNRAIRRRVFGEMLSAAARRAMVRFPLELR